MLGSSRASLDTARERLDAIAAGDGVDRSRVADELFSVASLLRTQSTLRRGISDPAMPASARSGLIRQLLAGQASDATLGVLSAAVEQRWSSPKDLVEALELLGVQSLLIEAEAAGQLEAVEDEVFRFTRILEGEPQLMLALTDPAVAAERKTALLDSLLADKATDVTRTLVRRTVAERRGLPLERALAEVSELAAARRQRLVATVTSAVPLDDAQVERLTGALQRAYARDLHLQVQVDPSVVGGLVVRVGDELIDGSVRHRLVEAARAVTR